MSPQAQQHSLTGMQHFLRRNYPIARDHFIQAIRLDPGCADYYFNAGMSLWSNGQIAEAGPYLQAAVRIKPNLAAAQAWLGEWSLSQGLIDDALKATAAALDLEPKNPVFLLARAWVLAANDPAAAWQITQTLLATAPITPPLARLYGILAPRFNEEAQALALIDRLLTTPAGSADSALKFTAVDLLDRAARYDAAFALAASANASQQAAPYDANMQESLTNRLIEFFTPERIRSLPKSSLRTNKPVFIVGMPRSGTSLVEQIAASHPAVHGAGELKFMHHLWTRLLQTIHASTFEEYPMCLTKLTPAQADDIAKLYLNPLIALKPTAQRITDKMPLNFLHIGLIATLFPDARIIHCTRDPLDTCLSCFFTHFTEPHTFKTNLAHLAHFHRQYARLMTHWKTATDLPILELPYEQLVANQEPQSRRLIEFLGLPWNDRCLTFHKTNRPCSTASVMQVRQPIYQTSVNRWRHYEKHLRSLKDALAAPRTHPTTLPV